MSFFRELGVPLHEEPGGKLFPGLEPLAGRAGRTPARGQRPAARRCSPAIACTRSIEPDAGSRFRPHTARLKRHESSSRPAANRCRRAAATAPASAFAKRLGHSLVATTPGLVPLTMSSDSHFHAQLSGVSHPAEIAVWVDGRVAIRLTGSLLWTHFGISGPLALDASRHWLRARSEGGSAALDQLNFYPGLDVRRSRPAPDDDRAHASPDLRSKTRSRPAAETSGRCRRRWCAPSWPDSGSMARRR